jgi:hypothetical protein
MALTKQTMTDEQRKSDLKAFDNDGVTSTGGSILDSVRIRRAGRFSQVGLATGTEQIGKLFGDVGATIKSIVHHYSHFN